MRVESNPSFSRPRGSALHLALAGLLLAQAAYAVVFIRTTSFMIDGERYYSLMDDAMISMRYAENIAAGRGAVWNPGGERVEGFTNPLWTGWMALVHLMGLPKSHVSVVVQATSGVLLLGTAVVAWWLARRVTAERLGDSAPREAIDAAGFAAAGLCAFYIPLANWALQGMEVGALALLVAIAAALAIGALKRGTVSRAAYLLLALATWIRIDAAVAHATLLAYFLVVDRARRREHLAWGLGSLAAFLGVQTALRFFYYGDLLPNTFYLKLTGFPLLLRLSRGAIVFAQFVAHTNWLLVAFPFVAFAAMRSRALGLLLSIFAAQCAYSVWVGGDAWEWWGGANRYIAVAMPLFFAALAATASAAAARALVAWSARRGTHTGAAPDSRIAGAHPPSRRRAMTACAFLLACLAVVSVNGVRDVESLRQWLLRKPPLLVAENRDKVRLGLLIRERTPADATIAVVWAGAIPYFAERNAVDLLGKADRTIARLPSRPISGRSKWYVYFPGHMKWDPDHSIRALRPDVVTQLWGDGNEAEEYLEADYAPMQIEDFTVWVRRGLEHLVGARPS
jgi:arabinofuranosyltransferase